jgi:hypothetical protein
MILSNRLQNFYSALEPTASLGTITFHYADKSTITCTYNNLSEKIAYRKMYEADAKYYTIHPIKD